MSAPGTTRRLSLEDLPLRDDLRGEEPYGAPQLEVPVRLNVNENPYPPSDTLVAAIGAAAESAARSVNRYPDREAYALRADLAGYVAGREGVVLDVPQVWAANGSNEVMLQLLQAFGGPGRVALGFAPTYSMYPEYCRDTFTTWVTEPRAADFTVDADTVAAAIRRHRPVVTVLTSPNNPTGTALPQAVAESALAAADEHGGLVVVDEAYAEFRRPGTASAVALLAGNPRLIVTRTMSKAFAYAGGRLGYALADPAVVDALRVVRLPYHLSAISQAVARAALGHAAELLAQVDTLRSERDALVSWLREAAGVRAADSDANFVLFGVFADRHAAWQSLLEQGVLIRETGPVGWLRVSVGTPEEMSAFRNALLATLATHVPSETGATAPAPAPTREARS